MQDKDGAQWQITCPCGWRTHGPLEEVVTEVQEHSLTAHDEELSDKDAADSVIPLSIT